MTSKFLHRGDAPFSDEVWAKIDDAVVGAARATLAGRRLLHVEGPYGLGLKVLPSGDAVVQEQSDAAGLTASCMTPVAVIRKDFALAARDVAAFEQRGTPMDLGAAAMAAVACAQQEDALVFTGSKPLQSGGLMSTKGVRSVGLGAWADEVGVAAENVIEAVTALDDAGFHGPYAMALAPRLYNLLYRRYPQGNQSEMEHVRAIVTEGVVKAPALADGGLVIASGRQYATIVLGQDLAAGFVGPSSGDYELTVSESVALWLRVPDAICLLK